MIAAGWWFYLARRERSVAADLESSWYAIERNASRLIGVVALSAAIVAATFATRSAAGADASGYLSQAAMWSMGQEFYFESFDPPFQFPDRGNGWLMTPLGWLPPDQHLMGGLQAPTYPPGLPLLMAIPHALAGLKGAVAVVIASTALGVWATGMLAGGVAGVLAAILIAFSPVFVYQSIQPMSDVPVTAAWMLCFLLISGGDKPSGLSSVWAGIACAIAVLIRPNLAPIAIVPLFLAGNRLQFAVPVAIAGLVLAYLHTFWYGSPIQSGYGAAEELFALANIGPNAAGYFNWLLSTAPALLLASFGFLRVRGDRHSRGLAVFALLVIAAYLIYGVFDHWSYLRFLLPALAVFAIFAAIDLNGWLNRWSPAWRAPLFVGLVLVLIAHSFFVARALDTFKLADQLRRVEQVAQFVNDSAPDYAVILSGEQSGSMRYYTGRSILRWEAAAAEELAAAIGSLTESSRPVYIVLDAWEDELFRKKFAAIPTVVLDWPAAVEAGSTHRTRAWRVADRARFLAGENLQTVRLP